MAAPHNFARSARRARAPRIAAGSIDRTLLAALARAFDLDMLVVEATRDPFAG